MYNESLVMQIELGKVPMKNKSILIFGAGVIAEGYALRFAEAGANLMIVSRGTSCINLADYIQQSIDVSPSQSILTMNADGADFGQLQTVYEECYKHFGTVDAVINGSGGNQPEAVVSSLETFANMDPQTSVSLMMNNYFAKRYSIQLYAKWLMQNRHEGSVVNITSMAGLQPLSKVIDYSAAYSAVESLTKSTAFLFAKHNIGRVNNVAVGFTIGQQNKRLVLNEDGTPTPRGTEILNGTSQHRFLDAKEIAEPVCYLADAEKSHAINGHTLKVDAGFNLVSLPATS